MIECLNESYSTTRLCYKLFDDGFLDENGKIKEEYKFKLNFPEFGIIDSKIPAKKEEKFDTYLFLPEGEGRKGEGGLRTRGYFKLNSDSGKVIVDSNIKLNNHNNLPLITIITVVYNGEKYLEETIQSVINQTYPNVEYIIIDGSSTDRTIDIIKKYEDYIDYWVSEKDGGIYDAMNKGIDASTGTWVNFMNAGDTFEDNEVLSKIKFDQYNNKALIYGNKLQNNEVIYPLDINKLEVGEIMACHQSMFFNKQILKDELYYDLTYKIYGDFELVNRIYLKFKNDIKYIDLNIAVFQGGGISSKVSLQKRIDKYRALFEHYGFFGLVRGIVFRIFKECIGTVQNSVSSNHWEC